MSPRRALPAPSFFAPAAPSAPARVRDHLLLVAAALCSGATIAALVVVGVVAVALLFALVWLTASRSAPLGLAALGLPLAAPARVQTLLEDAAYPMALAGLTLLAMRKMWGAKTSPIAVLSSLLDARRARASHAGALAEIEALTGIAQAPRRPARQPRATFAPTASQEDLP